MVVFQKFDRIAFLAGHGAFSVVCACCCNAYASRCCAGRRESGAMPTLAQTHAHPFSVRSALREGGGYSIPTCERRPRVAYVSTRTNAARNAAASPPARGTAVARSAARRVRSGVRGVTLSTTNRGRHEQEDHQHHRGGRAVAHGKRGIRSKLVGAA